MADVCVFGLWHLGCVTAACVAAAGQSVIGLDFDEGTVARLSRGEPPLFEPGLVDLVSSGLAQHTLRFTTDPAEALQNADVLWVTFDTPVDDDDVADVAWVRQQLDAVRPVVKPGCLVLISSQVPVGFTQAVERDWQNQGTDAKFAHSPENLRLGNAIEVFRHPGRVVIGTNDRAGRTQLAQLFAPFCSELIWMSVPSAEMTKHALNSFLALSVAYANELARLCDSLGANAADVEKGLRTDPRVGLKAYVSPGPPIAGGTLARDVTTLNRLALEHAVKTPVIGAIPDSNHLHEQWLWQLALDQVSGLPEPVAAILGLTYKAGTDTLRRSPALAMARWLGQQGVQVHAFDPALSGNREDLGGIELRDTLDQALAGADIAIVPSARPEFKELTSEDLRVRMRHPQLLDPTRTLTHLDGQPGLTYLTVGRRNP